MKCRLCAAELDGPFLSLGPSPLANGLLAPEDLARPEPSYPLDVRFCRACGLVQVDQHETPEAIFTDYPYFSSVSDTWIDHVRRYAEEMTAELSLGPGCLVVEVASNDGHLLKCFKAKRLDVLGIEPARNVAAAANALGVPTLAVFFGAATARRLRAETRGADLLVANNVFAHVPDPDDFAEGLKTLLNPGGLLTIEFPHLLNLLAETQFDTIYHEHFSYFSLGTASRALAARGLRVHDVRELATHGGSLRLYVSHESERRAVSPRVEDVLRRERDARLAEPETYAAFAARAERLRSDIRAFLEEKKRESKTVAAYGAPAKGNTLLNYCGIGTDWIAFTVDKSEHKQRKFLPGSRIPVRDPEAIERERPDYVLILPWNLKEEVMRQMACVRHWGGRFVVPVPALEVIP